MRGFCFGACLVSTDPSQSKSRVFLIPEISLAQLGLSAEHLKQLQTLLVKYVPQAEVWAYGSRVNGGSHEGSDLDIVVRTPVNLDRPVDHITALRDAIASSNLPMLTGIQPWSSLPESFQRNIESAYVKIQG